MGHSKPHHGSCPERTRTAGAPAPPSRGSSGISQSCLGGSSEGVTWEKCVENGEAGDGGFIPCPVVSGSLALHQFRLRGHTCSSPARDHVVLGMTEAPSGQGPCQPTEQKWGCTALAPHAEAVWRTAGLCGVHCESLHPDTQGSSPAPPKHKIPPFSVLPRAAAKWETGATRQCPLLQAGGDHGHWHGTGLLRIAERQLWRVSSDHWGNHAGRRASPRRLPGSGGPART